jgi:hypothetical protein
MDRHITYEQKIKMRRQHAADVLEFIAVLCKKYGAKNNNVLERAHLQVSEQGMLVLGEMIKRNKVKDDDLDFLTWLPAPPAPVKKAKAPRKSKIGASEYQREHNEYKDNLALEDFSA